MLKLGRNEERVIIITIVLIIVTIIVYRFIVFKTDSVKVIKSDEETKEQVQAETSGDIYVYVSGEVKNPGVYKLKTESRVMDAINAAGGFTENADTSSINLAEKITDGQQINIAQKGSSGSSTVENKGPYNGGKININNATAAELDAFLPGIGETLAKNIVDYREKNGKFKSINEISRVDRIGSGKTFERIKDLITVN